jgi:putative transposase
MKRSRFSEEQIIAILREQEAGAKTAEVCRKHGVSGATFYKWKAKYGGMEVSDARRLKTLEDENTRLKKLLAETMLDNAMLRDVAAKNGDARRQTRSCFSPRRGLRGEPAAGVPDDRRGSQFGPLPQPAAGR